jgi:phage tail-like protein
VRDATIALAGVFGFGGPPPPYGHPHLAVSGPAVSGRLEDPSPARRSRRDMPSAHRDDPYKTFNFLVEIDGIAVAAFSEVSGLESETEVIEYRAGGETSTVRKLPGLTKYANIVLRRGVTQDVELWNWRKTVEQGAVDRRNGSIVLLDDDRTPVLRWNFFNGWISKWVGPVLNAKGNEVAIETIEIAHEGLTRD